ncbi:hypothetical protein PQR34_42925 [Paraburkholderia sediminicola]|uniref:hypothetical protein n=1 Tax=Paraburkholderia sediminicola TaxID=458836 RepID=UPI0038B72599
MNKVARALSFAHLTGTAAQARAADDDDKPPAERDHEDGDAKKGSKASGAQDDTGPEDDDRSARAADDGGDDDKPADDEDNDSGKGKRSRKAKSARAEDEGEDEDARAEDDPDDDKEMRGHSPLALARRREQARCALIFASKAAARNPSLAAQLAFNTRLPRGEAVALLEASPVPASVTATPDRAARNPHVGPGGSVQVSSTQAIAASWDRAFASVIPSTVRARGR